MGLKRRTGLSLVELLLVVASIGLVFVSFNQLRKYLGRNLTPTTAAPLAGTTQCERDLDQRIPNPLLPFRESLEKYGLRVGRPSEIEQRKVSEAVRVAAGIASTAEATIYALEIPDWERKWLSQFPSGSALPAGFLLVWTPNRLKALTQSGGWEIEIDTFKTQVSAFGVPLNYLWPCGSGNEDAIVSFVPQLEPAQTRGLASAKRARIPKLELTGVQFYVNGQRWESELTLSNCKVSLGGGAALASRRQCPEGKVKDYEGKEYSLHMKTVKDQFEKRQLTPTLNGESLLPLRPKYL